MFSSKRREQFRRAGVSRSEYRFFAGSMRVRNQEGRGRRNFFLRPLISECWHPRSHKAISRGNSSLFRFSGDRARFRAVPGVPPREFAFDPIRKFVAAANSRKSANRVKFRGNVAIGRNRPTMIPSRLGDLRRQQQRSAFRKLLRGAGNGPGDCGERGPPSFSASQSLAINRHRNRN